MPGKTGKEETLASRFFSFSTILAVFGLDRLLKIWVVRNFLEGQGISLFGPWVHLTRVSNTGAAFGLWKDSGVFLVCFSAVSFLIVFFYLFKKPAQPHSFAWALIAGGALGNLVDRLAYGYVIDYLDLRVWPVFNLADASICLGVIWILFRFTARRPPRENNVSRPF